MKKTSADIMLSFAEDCHDKSKCKILPTDDEFTFDENDEEAFKKLYNELKDNKDKFQAECNTIVGRHKLCRTYNKLVNLFKEDNQVEINVSKEMSKEVNEKVSEEKRDAVKYDLVKDYFAKLLQAALAYTNNQAFLLDFIHKSPNESNFDLSNSEAVNKIYHDAKNNHEFDLSSVKSIYKYLCNFVADSFVINSEIKLSDISSQITSVITATNEKPLHEVLCMLIDQLIDYVDKASANISIDRLQGMYRELYGKDMNTETVNYLKNHLDEIKRFISFIRKFKNGKKCSEILVLYQGYYVALKNMFQNLNRMISKLCQTGSVTFIEMYTDSSKVENSKVIHESSETSDDKVMELNALVNELVGCIERLKGEKFETKIVKVERNKVERTETDTKTIEVKDIKPKGFIITESESVKSLTPEQLVIYKNKYSIEKAAMYKYLQPLNDLNSKDYLIESRKNDGLLDSINKDIEQLCLKPIARAEPLLPLIHSCECLFNNPTSFPTLNHTYNSNDFLYRVMLNAITCTDMYCVNRVKELRGIRAIRISKLARSRCIFEEMFGKKNDNFYLDNKQYECYLPQLNINYYFAHAFTQIGEKIRQLITNNSRFESFGVNLLWDMCDYILYNMLGTLNDVIKPPIPEGDYNKDIMNDLMFSILCDGNVYRQFTAGLMIIDCYPAAIYDNTTSNLPILKRSSCFARPFRLAK